MWRRVLTTFFLLVFLASSVAAFGPWGIAVAAYLLACLVALWSWRAGSKEAGIVLWVVVLVPVAWALLLPAVRSGPAAPRSQCSTNLHAIGLALLNYEHQNRCFPPAYVCDKDGKPAHSWRVLILPYVENMPLYRKYDFNEPWNGPNNRLLAANMPPGYICPAGYAEGANRRPMTSYVVVTGAGTAFPGRETRKLDDITDEKRDSILVVEVANSDIHWMEPRDASLEDLTASRGGSSQPLSSHHDAESDYWHYFQLDGGYVVCADNSVHCLPGRIRPEDVKAIVSISGGERVRIDDLAEKHLIAGLRWDHVIGLPLFCLSFVALLCLAMTTRRRERQLAPEGSSPTVEAPP